MNEKGIMTFMVGLMIVILMLILLWSVFLPMLQIIQVESFVAQQGTLSDINATIQELPDSTQKAALLTSFNTEIDSTVTQFDIISFFIQYWWVFVVFIVSFGTYLLQRRNVEVQGGF